MLTGRHTHAEFYHAFGRQVPRGLQLYDSLGRFRDAILAHRFTLEEDEVKREAVRKFTVRFSACIPIGARSW